MGDLNVSKIIGKNMALNQAGTSYYSSPLIWNDHPYDYKYDIWSAGNANNKINQNINQMNQINGHLPRKKL